MCFGILDSKKFEFCFGYRPYVQWSLYCGNTRRSSLRGQPSKIIYIIAFAKFSRTLLIWNHLNFSTSSFPENRDGTKSNSKLTYAKTYNYLFLGETTHPPPTKAKIFNVYSLCQQKGIPPSHTTLRYCKYCENPTMGKPQSQFYTLSPVPHIPLLDPHLYTMETGPHCCWTHMFTPWRQVPLGSSLAMEVYNSSVQSPFASSSFFIHTVMHRHLKRIFIILFSAFVCVVYKVFQLFCSLSLS